MAAAVAAATVAVAGFVGFQFLGGADAPAPEPSPPAEVTTELGALPERAVPDAQTSVAAPVPEVAAVEPQLPDPEPTPEADPAAPIAPSFDLVRVDAAGGAVIAGRAAANADLRLRLDGQEILMASSDGTGSFVAMLSIPASDLPQVLSLEMVMAGGDVLISDQSVIIQPATGVAAAEPAADASPDLPVIDTDLPELASAADPAPASATPEVPQLVAPDSPGVVPATAAAEEGATAPVTELALLEAEAPGAGLPGAPPIGATATEPAATTDSEPAITAPVAADVAGGGDGLPETPPATATATEVAEIPATSAEPPTAPIAPVAATADATDATVPQAGDMPEATETASVALAPETPVIAPSEPAVTATPQPTAPDPTQEASTPAAPGAVDAIEASEPQAPTVMIADSQGIRVLQSGGPEPQVQVVLDSISYDTEGEVVLTGRGPAQSDVRLYLDNQPVQLARIDTAGGWTTQLPQVDPGTYTLRVDEVSAEGAVLSRVETPFLREEPAVLEALPQRDGVSVITVQPGHTLWGIAREQLGAGVLYVQVYEANRDLIRDPHWIYPGQIFAIPDDIEGQ